MIITIGGKAGSGKSTVAKLIAEELGLKHYSVGDLQRQLAKEKGISLLELSKLEEKDPKVDKQLDEKQKLLGERGDNFVIDSRLGAMFIPHADFKIFLDADEKIRAKRILKDKRAIEKSKTTKQTIANIKKREASENKRYKKYYRYDCYDLAWYDLVIDTTGISPKEVVDKIIAFIRR